MHTYMRACTSPSHSLRKPRPAHTRSQVRFNLDPSGAEHADASLGQALRGARLLTEADGSEALTALLNTRVDSGGANFSAGQ